MSAKECRTFTADAFARARRFVIEDGRRLDTARLIHLSEGNPPDDVVTALGSYQNADGGFGRGLEPDCRTPSSSGLAMSVAFQILDEISSATQADDMIRKALGWLVEAYDHEVHAWSIIPPDANDSPRAPWWNWTPETPAKSIANPSPELLAVLYEYEVDGPLRELATSHIVKHLDEAEELEAHELICYVRLADSSAVRRAGFMEPHLDKIKLSAAKSVSLDPEQWISYGLRPSSVAPNKDAFLYRDFEHGIEAELDFLIDSQGEDGAWAPTWTWYGAYPDVFPVAEREWKGVLTVAALKLMRTFGRM